MLYLVELFCGSKSVSRTVKNIFGDRFDVQVLSVDLDPSFKPDVCVDINNWDYKRDCGEFLKRRRKSDSLFVSQSPPCTSFSRANTTGVRDLEGGRRNVLSSLKITKYLQPDAWFLENPVGLLKE